MYKFSQVRDTETAGRVSTIQFTSTPSKNLSFEEFKKKKKSKKQRKKKSFFGAFVCGIDSNAQMSTKHFIDI